MYSVLRVTLTSKEQVRTVLGGYTVRTVDRLLTRLYGYKPTINSFKRQIFELPR